MPLIKPKPLGKGSTIGLVAPAVYLDNEPIRQGAEVLQKMGYKTKVHPSCQLRHHCRAGTAKQRAQAINDMFADPEVDGILCVRAGSGCLRTEPHIDYDIIRQNPKVFCGFSDATLLLHIIQKKTGMVTFHGPVLFYMLSDNALELAHFSDVMAGNKVSVDLPEPRLMKKGKGTGKLIGGNMCAFISLMGSAEEPDTDGAILFIEDIYEAHHSLDRMLWHLKHAGKLENLAGVILSELPGVEESFVRSTGASYGITVWDSLMEIFEGKNIPIVGNTPVGHGDCTLTLPVGIKATLRVTDKNASLTLEEGATAFDRQEEAV